VVVVAILGRDRVRGQTPAETRNSTNARMKKMILAISMDAPATPPKPRMPAIKRDDSET